MVGKINNESVLTVEAQHLGVHALISLILHYFAKCVDRPLQNTLSFNFNRFSKLPCKSCKKKHSFRNRFLSSNCLVSLQIKSFGLRT